jgi:hypothetical protein
MYTLRCTQKLLRRVGEIIEPEPPAPTTMLGDWYANVVTVAGKPFVLAVSERTFLPLVVPLREARTLRRRVQEQAAEVLLRLRVPQARFEHEVEQMSDAVLGRTASRRVVGVLVDFAYQLQARADRTDALIALSLRLGETPCGPLKMESPERVTRALFERR